MTYKEYDEAVKKIYEMFREVDDQDIKDVFEVVSNMWSDNEGDVIEKLTS